MEEKHEKPNKVYFDVRQEAQSALMSIKKGDRESAIKKYNKIINIEKNNPIYYFNLACILSKDKKLESIDLLAKALALNPNFAEAYFKIGCLYYEIGQYIKSINYYKQLIRINPNHPIVHFNIGIAYQHEGDNINAISSFTDSLTINPNISIAFFHLGNLYVANGEENKGIDFYKKSVHLNPNHASTYVNLIIISLGKGEMKLAEETYKKLLKIKVDTKNEFKKLGLVFYKRSNIEYAINALKRSLLLNPEDFETYYLLGNIYKGIGQLKIAIKYYHNAILFNNRSKKSFNNLGVCFQQIGDLKSAISSYKEALNIDSKYLESRYNLSTALAINGEISSSIESFKQTLLIKEDFSEVKASLLKNASLICDWNSVDEFLPWIKDLGINGSSVDPYKLLHLEDDPTKNFKRAVKRYEEQYLRKSISIIKKKREKIRLGYFSADFRSHPVMLLIAKVLELHDKSKFELFAYSFCTKPEDNYTLRVKKSFDSFKNIKELNESEAVQLARDDDLDIAIDLMGYTKNNRLAIFCNRIAPIQISYLGYPGTTGSKEMDYIIADKTVIPTDSKKFYSEKVLYVPDCYMCFDDTRKISYKYSNRKELGLPSDSFVLTAFHNPSKITSKEFDCWAEILLRVEKSVLWLSKSNKEVEENLRKELFNRGIGDEKIVFAEKIASHSEHLGRHTCGDIFVDTFKYNAHSTAIDSLWSGLPVLTLMGNYFSSRVGASLLKSLQLDELIANNEREYIEIAIDLSNNKNKLDNIKNKLDELRKTSPLFNSSLFTKKLESIYINLINK